jgi:hypothetical protein
LSTAEQFGRRLEKEIAVAIIGELCRREGRSTAFHECAHAYVATKLDIAISIVTVVPEGVSPGHMAYAPFKPRPPDTKEETEETDTAIPIDAPPSAPRTWTPDRRSAIEKAALVMFAKGWRCIRAAVRRGEHVARCILYGGGGAEIVERIAAELEEKRTFTAEEFRAALWRAERAHKASGVSVVARDIDRNNPLSQQDASLLLAQAGTTKTEAAGLINARNSDSEPRDSRTVRSPLHAGKR